MGGEIRGVNCRVPAYLENEPIYCPAPSPSTSGVASPKSIDKIGEIARAARIERYEQVGLRYLRGGTLNILSANLYGPFDKASGWQNPWLPKPTPQRYDSTTGSLRAGYHSSTGCITRNVSSGTRAGADVEAIEEEGNEERGVELADHSMDYHLPSPQSHEGLQSIQSPLTITKRCRIASWAEGIEGPSLEKDDFWAPDQGFKNGPGNDRKRRTDSTDWLKRRPLKKTRHQTPQIPAESPKAGKRTKTGEMKASAIAQKSEHRSFETTTPSSSTDEEPRDLLDMVKNAPEAARGEGIIQTHADQSPCVMPCGSGSGVGGETNATSQSQRRTETGPEDEKMNTVSDFHLCADESFFYRARPTKPATSADGSPTTTAAVLSRSTRSDAPASSSHSDDALALPHTDTEQPSWDAMSVSSDVESRRRSESPITLSLREEGSGSGGTVPCIRPMEAADGNTPTDAPVPSTSIPLSNIPSSHEPSPVRASKAAPETLPEVKSIQVTRRGTPLDDDSTLVGEPMDFVYLNYYRLVQAARDALDVHASPQMNLDDEGTFAEPVGYSEDSTACEMPTSMGAPLIVSNPFTTELEQQVGNPVKGSGKEQNLDATIPEKPLVAGAMSFPLGATDSPIIRPSQQSPWTRDFAEAPYIIAQDRDTNSPPALPIGLGSARDIRSPEQPLKSAQSSVSRVVLPLSNASSDTLKSRPGQEGGNLEHDEATSSTSEQQCTMIPSPARQTTPGVELSVKSFASFQLSPTQPRDRYLSTPMSSRGILSRRSHIGTGAREKPSRRVSFGPLPNEEDYSDSVSPLRTPRAVSPPLSTIVDTEGENVGGRYQRHFDAMNRRVEKRRNSQLRHKQRLLPSSSQQGMESPPAGAMAEAFLQADAQVSKCASNVQQEESVPPVPVAQFIEVGDNADMPQSPWQRGEEEDIDDVAAVLGNLGQFLGDAWDVEAELERNREQFGCSAERHEAQSITDMGMLQSVGQW
ncbi:hypothetical protein F5Y17DRAFT_416237 [Xylariaceae sp. FL0594]|nr:hypothetical protein F5Y17DRAFT_416237 [Xylariaceae sp. FL0594]